jgi:hypothetical protein
MINIPSAERRWSQTNDSDLNGNVYVTKNISFDDVGYLKLSNSPRSIYNRALDDNFRHVNSIAFMEGSMWYQASRRLYRSDALGDLAEDPREVVETGTPITFSFSGDMTWFDDKFVVATSSRLHYRTDSNDWTETSVTLSTTFQGQHPLADFVSTRTLAVANINTVRTYSELSATPTLSETLTIPTDYMITQMVYFNQNLYIGTRHKNGQKAVMYVWNGSGTAAQQAFQIDSHIIHSLVAFQGTIYALSSSGALLRFNGAGFDLAAAFPIFHTPEVFADYQNISIYKQSMVANDDVIFINISSTQTQGEFLPDQPSGVWCYEPRVGLYHKYAWSIAQAYDISVLNTNVNTTTNVFTTASTVPVTGTAVIWASGNQPAPLERDETYYIIRLSSTTFKLAETQTDAIEGNEINITTQGPSSHTIRTFPDIDYGVISSGNRPFATEILRNGSNRPQYGQDVIYGNETEDRTGTLGQFLNISSSTLPSRGFFVTPKILSQNITDHFNNFVVKFKPLQKDDKIIVKYRTQDDNMDKITAGQWGITWTSTNTFTTTQKRWSEAKIGDEVNVLSGAGGGLLAHITNITETGGTYTVTIDDAFANYASGDKAQAIFRNFTKFLEIDHTNDTGFEDIQMDARGKFIQIKVELRGVGVRIEELQINNKTLLPSRR